MANPKKQKLVNKQGTTIYPLTEVSQIIVDEDGTRLNTVLDNIDTKWAGCWISFTDENGNPTDEPYIHWYTEPAAITFTIGSTTYSAEEGMTWAEWVDSDYNTGNFYTDSDKIRNTTGNVFNSNTSVDYVYINDIIQPNHNYVVIAGGGSND